MTLVDEVRYLRSESGVSHRAVWRADGSISMDERCHLDRSKWACVSPEDAEKRPCKHCMARSVGVDA